MYMLTDNITVRDDVTMITIGNVSDSKCVMGEILKQILSMNMDVDIVDYHNNYKGSQLTLLVENSGILRITSAVGMFKDKISGILCDIYCLNTSISIRSENSPVEDAVAIMTEFNKNQVELYHIYSGLCGITVVINEAYTDTVCDILMRMFGN